MESRLEKIEPVTSTSLQLNEDIRFFKKELIFQRVGSVCMLFLILCGCIGIFGTGILSHSQKQESGILMEYSRFLRFNNEETILFKMNETAGETVIKIPLTYSEKFEIRKIIPEPAHTEVNNGWIVYHFPTTGKSGIRFSVAASEAGKVKSHIYVNGQTFSFSQFIYP